MIYLIILLSIGIVVCVLWLTPLLNMLSILCAFVAAFVATFFYNIYSETLPNLLKDISSINDGIEFIQFEDKTPVSIDSYVLVKNMPRNVLEQSKIMVNYFDSVGLSINDLSKMPDIKYYYMWFYKSTNATHSFFTELNKYQAENKTVPEALYKRFESKSHRDHLGYVYMPRCKSDSTKWRIKVSKKIGTDIDGYSIYESTVLLNECETDFLYVTDVKENKELTDYYTELRNKKNVKR